MIERQPMLRLARRFLAAAIAAAAFATPASASLPQVATHLRALQTMTANFTQTSGSGAVARGKLTLARPGKVRFQYEPSVPLLIVADGKSLAMIDYEVSQVSKWPIRGTPLSVLLDPNTDIAKYGRVLPPGQGGLPGFLTVESKDKKHPEYGTITMYFAPDAKGPGGLSLSGWRVLDAQGNVTQVQLSNARFNVAVDPTSFTYRDPRSRPRLRSR
jgi:outer membrane lipoprotein-sorting protein